MSDTLLRIVVVTVLVALGILLMQRLPVVVTDDAVAEDSVSVLDGRLDLTLVASDPDIVTPIGLAVDSSDHLFVLESHTHFEPFDYDGPEGDRVKIFEPSDDGLTQVGIFAAGIDNAMNVAFSPEGVLHVVTSRSVFALYDRDGDGRSEERERLLHMDPPSSVYDHAGLMGIAFSDDGWMYVSRGNVGGAEWRLTGTDGSWVDGYGDGGNIVRARFDGTNVHEIATGFWNPFYIFFDAASRLLVTDNDPDSRGPNRLLHVIEGGDYGYKALYGGSGIHPYLAWNGELPGTLPYAAGLGEAPTGCIEITSGALPATYAHDLLCAIWEESSIVRVDLSPRGVSIQGTTQPVIQGDARFRPVVMAATSDGTIYVTDWVVRAYPNHGQGRIWRLRASTGDEEPLPANPIPPSSTLAEVYEADSIDHLREAFESGDPFLRAAAVTVMSRPSFHNVAIRATRDPDADVRLGALLALQRADHRPAASIARLLLHDADARVRRMALIWIGKAGMTELRPDIERLVSQGRLPAEQFDTYLATERHLNPDFIEAVRARSEEASGRIERRLPVDFVADFAADPSRPIDLRAAALSYLEDPEMHIALLVELAEAEHEVMRRSAIEAITRSDAPERLELLLDIAESTEEPSALRADALLGLYGETIDPVRIASLLEDEAEAVRVEAARLLQSEPPDSVLATILDARLDSLDLLEEDERVAQQLALARGRDRGGRPASLPEWQQAAAAGGDPEIGRRVFFSPRTQCATCHTFDHVGGQVGPDLSNIGASMSTEQLVRAVVDPSAEVAPGWQAWYVIDATGTRHLGRQIDVGGAGVELFTPDGRFTDFPAPRRWGVADQSLMPEGLSSLLTVADFQDLVAFLELNE